MADPRSGSNDGYKSKPGSSYRTESLEVECNSSRAAPSTTQSVENYDPESVQPSEGDSKATLMCAGGQFPSPAATPARNASVPEPEQPNVSHSARPFQRGDTVTKIPRSNHYSIQSNQAPKRRGSTLDDNEIAQRYRAIPPASARQGRALQLAQVSSLLHDRKARVFGAGNEILESPTSLSSNEESHDEESYGGEEGDSEDNNFGSDRGEEDEGTDSPATPRP